MFTVKEVTTVKFAAEYVKKLLAELDTPKSLEFQVIHSISETECDESGGDWNVVSEIVYDYLHDLDSTQGYMRLTESGCWDYMEWDERDETDVYKPDDETEEYVYAKEGLVVLYNTFAICEDQYPVIVVKKSFWDHHSKQALELLKNYNLSSDYTSKISPAVYVELFYT
jgi:hypothetical protein